jgi:hypothetical protein
MSSHLNDPDQPSPQHHHDEEQVTPVSMPTGKVPYRTQLPLSPVDEYFSSPHERFQIALSALDSIVAERPGQNLSYPQLRGEIMHRTGLGWAPAALAINFRQERPGIPAPDRMSAFRDHVTSPHDSARRSPLRPAEDRCDQ